MAGGSDSGRNGAGVQETGREEEMVHVNFTIARYQAKKRPLRRGLRKRDKHPGLGMCFYLHLIILRDTDQGPALSFRIYIPSGIPEAFQVTT